jgi:hypothetical protein
MPLNIGGETIDVDSLCAEIDLDLSLLGLQITLPVGFNLEADFTGIPNPGDIAGKLLARANAALAPLSPIFDIIDLLLVLKDVLDAVKSLDPMKISKKLVKFKAKLDKLRKLIPQLSIPVTIKSVVNVLIVLLVGIRIDLQAIIDAQAKIDLAGQRAIALGNLDLQASLSCAQANLDAQMELASAQVAPLNRLIFAVNLFCEIAGLPKLPELSDLGEDAEAALAPIDKLIAQLGEVKKAIPG